MPIRREHRYFYPIDWKQLSAVIRFMRARGRCEGCGRPTEGARTDLMPRALETDGLPIVLAMALWPWIDAIEAAACNASKTLRLAAERAARDLRRLIVITAPLETMLEDALQASRRLANIATEQARDMPYVRMEALLTLNDLIAWLRRAKPSEWAEVTGISW